MKWDDIGWILLDSNFEILFFFISKVRVCYRMKLEDSDVVLEKVGKKFGNVKNF